MNIVNNILLRIVLLPGVLYERLGVNTAQLKTIVSTKLLIDDRRPNTFQQASNRNKQKETTRATIGTMFISMILGCTFLFAFAISNNRTTQLTFFFSMFIFMLASTLISDFTSVLIDVRDNFIILPRPVNDKTVVVARLLHIFIHICKIVLPMVLPGVVTMFINYGFAAGIIMFILSLFVVLFTLFLINAVYIIILRITTPQKFQSIISYFQIVFAILIYSSYQIMPRLIRTTGTLNLDFADYPLMKIAPPYWFAVAWNTLYTLSGDAVSIVLTICSFLIPVLCIIAVVKYFAPSFNKKLTLIAGSDAGSTNISSAVVMEHKTTYSQWLSNLFAKGDAERTGFLFTWKMTARSKDFKIKVYPSVGYLVVYVVIMFFNAHNFTLQSVQEGSTQSRSIIVIALYMTSLLVLMALNQMIYSDKFKAAWMFYTAPVAAPGAVISGAVKSVILKFYMPVIVVIACIGFALIGVGFLPNLLLAVLNVIFVSALNAYLSFKALPFSRPQNIKVQSGSFIKNLFRMIILIVLGIIHYALYTITPVIIILAVLAAIAAWYVMDSIKKTSWSQLAAAEDLL
jgi:ABC-2 type transport system permease protein